MSEAVVDERIVKPQPGPQELFMSTPADIAIIGGSVYGGKTFCLAIEPIRHLDDPGFNAVCFRREMPDITNPGGLWDESKKWYPAQEGRPRESPAHEWFFPSGARIRFAGLQHEKDVDGWLGSQICLLMFDQLEAFPASMFWALWGRNRSLCGVAPYTRASCNPHPDSFLATLLAWWIDDETGYSIPERSGVIRFFCRVGEEIVWSQITCTPDEYDRYEEKRAAARTELDDAYPGDGQFAQGLTYVLARLQDNTIGKAIDPEYEAKVRAMPYVERERLLGGNKGGNWKIRPAAGLLFNRSWFEIVEAAPVDCIWVRYWDKAATQDAGCNSAGTKIGFSFTTGAYYIASCIAGKWSPQNREAVIKQTAAIDGLDVEIFAEQEPGSGGKESALNTVISLPGYNIHADPVKGDKMKRAYGLSAMSEARNVKLVRGAWNEAWLLEAHNFAPEAVEKDRIDSSSGAFNKLVLKVRNAFGISGGGGAKPAPPVPLGENGHSQMVDSEIMAAIRNGGGFGFR